MQRSVYDNNQVIIEDNRLISDGVEVEKRVRKLQFVAVFFRHYKNVHEPRN